MKLHLDCSSSSSLLLASLHPKGFLFLLALAFPFAGLLLVVAATVPARRTQRLYLLLH
jgi:hypothetical protein